MDHNKKVVELPLEDVLPNRFQPRIKFNEESIIELSESIKEHGVIQPIVVRPVGDKYEIIAGERRYKASTMAGLSTIPALITNFNDKESAEVALIENVQRKDLTPIEEAISYKKILDMGYLTQEKLADKLGKNQSTVANKLRLLNLDEEVQEALLEDKISERHARSLLKLTNPVDQKTILKRIIAERLTVRKTDEEINNMLNGKYVDVENNVVIGEEPQVAVTKTVEEKVDSVLPEEMPFDFSKLDFLSPMDNFSEKEEPLTQEIPKFEELLKLEEESEVTDFPVDYENNSFYNMLNDKIKDTENLTQNNDLLSNNLSNDEKIEDQIVDAPTPFVFNDLFINEDSSSQSIDSNIEEIEYIDDLSSETQTVEEPFDFSKLDFLKTDDLDKSVETIETNKKPEVTGMNTYVANNIKTVVNTIHNCADTIKKYGFNVEVDELEIDGEYRVTFSIKQ